MRIALAALLFGGGSNQAPVAQVIHITAEVPEQVSTTEPAKPVADNSVELESVEMLPVVRFTKNTTLYKTPDTDADEVGTIRKDARAAVLRDAEAGNGCATRWINIVPRGWACDVTTEATKEAPTRMKTFSFADEDPTPPVTGVYGIVRGTAQAYDTTSDIKEGNGRAMVGKNSVKAAGSVTIDGVHYWRTTGGDLIPSSSIITMGWSKFRGVVIEDAAKMPAWVRSHDNPREAVVTRDAPKGKRNGSLAPRTVVNVLETDGDWVRVGEDAWILRKDLRATAIAEAPEGIAEDEKWFDVDLDDQVIVAYEGTKPVYATMVSTGKYGHATPVEITRIQSKLERTTMTSDKQDVYSVADVPWTMFYDGNYALHTSYWHDGFGSVRSHGCINLAPYDARTLFRWSSPDVPPGWIAVKGDADNPGSLVRVHSAKLPDPALRGYARKMRELDSVATK